jgi:4-diphosphocytidyl-2-C-methyl-D-erythritol kinase
MTADVFAPAKINLTLHVTGQRADGYHLLDSLVTFADFGDQLTLTATPQMALEVSGPFVEGVPADTRNLAWQAAELAGWTGRITLEKNVPHGAGLGGGSADAAAVLRALGAPEHAAFLGADVPVCLLPVAQRMRGIGERTEAVSGLPPLVAVLANPGVHVPTPRVFAALAQKTNPPMPEAIPSFEDARDFMLWLRDQRNDLQPAAIGLAPVIDDVLQALAVEGAMVTRMSGSGATCFALLEDAALAGDVAADLACRHPGWWVRACLLS